MITMDTLEAMKTIALDSKKRIVLAKDSTCIGGLVILLSNADCCVVKDALQTLHLLCECKEAKTILKNHIGILDQLETLLTRGEKDVEVNRLAKLLLSELNEDSEPIQAPLKDSSNIARSYRNNSHHGRGTGKSIVLQLRGFQDKSDRDLCARLLLKINGVISITFDMGKKRCILRTKLDVKPETLASSIAKSMTMTAQQVVRNESGEESFITFNTSGNSGRFDKVDESLPDYLSDDSEMASVKDKAVKKPTDADMKKSANWFSAAANFLTNSFYW
uniref:Armadillo repeat-containing protein 1 n=1 Tax=Arion vulgaris TaxID=1028688 RepID=A0A0B6YE95_9EUPU